MALHPPAEKKTECIKVWLAPALELALRRLADNDDRKLSDYIGLVLARYVFGHANRVGDEAREIQADE